MLTSYMIQYTLHSTTLANTSSTLPGIQHESSVPVVRMVLNVNVRVSKIPISKQLTHGLQAIPTVERIQ